MAEKDPEAKLLKLRDDARRLRFELRKERERVAELEDAAAAIGRRMAAEIEALKAAQVDALKLKQQVDILQATLGLPDPPDGWEKLAGFWKRMHDDEARASKAYADQARPLQEQLREALEAARHEAHVRGFNTGVSSAIDALTIDEDFHVDEDERDRLVAQIRSHAEIDARIRGWGK